MTQAGIELVRAERRRRWTRVTHLTFSIVPLAMFAPRSICSSCGRSGRMARRGVFVRAEEVAFLEEVRRWRQQCVLVLTRATPQGPLYNATSKVIEAIDDVAEVVTGDRRTFYQRDATTPGEALPPVKWRTVK